MFLATIPSSGIAAVSADVLTARYHLHRRVAEQTEAFQWLLDTQYSVANDVVHPLDLPESMVVQLTTNGTLIITSSTVKRLSYFESTMYMGSCKEWIAPVAQYSMMNPEKCRRMVREFDIFSTNL